MRLRDYFTFGRPQGTAIAIFLQTVPIFFALLPGSPPIIRWPFGSGLAVIVTSLVGLFLTYALYQTISQISKSVLSVEMQKTKNKLVSVGMYAIVGLAASSIAYLLFIFPADIDIQVGVDDYTTGIALGLLYSVYIAVPQAVRIKVSVDAERRKRIIDDFLTEIEELRVNSGNELDGVSESISDLGEDLITELEKEPISGKGSLKTQLEEWLDDFDSARNLPQEKKLVNTDEDKRIGYITNSLSMMK